MLLCNFCLGYRRAYVNGSNDVGPQYLNITMQRLIVLVFGFCVYVMLSRNVIWIHCVAIGAHDFNLSCGHVWHLLLLNYWFNRHEVRQVDTRRLSQFSQCHIHCIYAIVQMYHLFLVVIKRCSRCIDVTKNKRPSCTYSL